MTMTMTMTMTIVKIMTSLHLDVASKDDPASLELTKMKWKVEDMEIWNGNMKWKYEMKIWNEMQNWSWMWNDQMKNELENRRMKIEVGNEKLE